MIADLISGLIVIISLVYVCGNSITVWTISAILLILAFLIKTFLHIEIGIKKPVINIDEESKRRNSSNLN